MEFEAIFNLPVTNDSFFIAIMGKINCDFAQSPCFCFTFYKSYVIRKWQMDIVLYCVNPLKYEVHLDNIQNFGSYLKENSAFPFRD